MQIAIRLSFSALLAIGALVLLHVSHTLIADLFGGRESTQVLSVRWIFCVVAFFVSGLAVVADHLTRGKCNRLTAIGAAVVLVHFGFAFWMQIEPDLKTYDKRIPFQYVWMVVSAILGAFTWWRVRRAALSAREQSWEKSLSRFSIGSIMVWFSLIAIFLALLVRSPAFPVPWDMSIVTKPKTEVFVAAALAFFLVPFVTKWLVQSRNFTFSAAGVWLIAFAGSWFMFCLIGLTKSEYDPDDQYVVKIVSFAFATMLYLVWLGIARRFLFGKNVFASTEQSKPGRIHQCSRWLFTAVTVILWGYLGFWLILNFSEPTGKRSADWIETSPEILAAFEEAYGSEVFEEVRTERDPHTVEEWSRCLGSREFPIEKDVVYRIYSLSRIYAIDQDDNQHLRKSMGFSREAVETLKDESFAGWVADRLNSQFDANESGILTPRMIRQAYTDLWHSSWTEESKPMFAKFCRDKKGTFQKIRDAIKDSEIAMIPPTENGFSAVTKASVFSSDMLIAESRFDLSKGNFELALNNLDSLADLAAIIGPYPLIEARTMNVLVHIAEAQPIDASTRQRIRDIVSKFESHSPRSATAKIRAFGATMMDFPKGVMREPGSNYLLAQKPLTVAFIDRFPGCIDWSEFVQGAKAKYFEPGMLNNDVAFERMSPAELAQLTSRPSRMDAQFHEQAIDLVSLPSVRSRRLGEYCVGKIQNGIRPRILQWARARIRRVGLKLLFYRAEHGEFPQSLEMIDGPIVDPFTGKSLLYDPEGNGDRFTLWSCGPNQADDAGLWFGKSDDLTFPWPAK